MNHTSMSILMFSLLTYFFSQSFGQELSKNNPKNDSKSNSEASEKLDEAQAAGDKVIFKDGTTKLLEIENLDNAGGLILYNTSVAGGGIGKYLQNNGGNLFWDGNQLGLAGAADNDWTISGNNIYNSNSGNVGIGTLTPNSLLSVGGSGPVNLEFSQAIVSISGEVTTATISGPTEVAGVYGSSSLDGIINGHPVTGYGGYFVSPSFGVYGRTDGDNGGYGVYGFNDGSGGVGVRGDAWEGGNNKNYGGYFVTQGDIGEGIFSLAISSANTTNYGGHFEAKGGTGRGIYGLASGAIGINYGGEFQADGPGGYGSHSTANGMNGVGVKGVASATGNPTNWGGYFTAASDFGIAVYGEATATDYIFSVNYGGYFTAAGNEGIGVYGSATKGGDIPNIGGKFEAAGDQGIAVKGKASSINSTNYGGKFEALGTTGYGIHATAPTTGWAGYFSGNASVSNRVFIGSTPASPSTSLHIKQQNAVNAVRMEYDSDTDYWDVYIDSANDYNFKYNGILKGWIDDADGMLKQSSDERLKNNIREIESILPAVLALQPKRYLYNADRNNNEQIGFVAQDVQKLFPEAVSEKDGYLGINYSVFGVLAIEAIKEQQTKIDDLEERLARLEARAR